MAAEEMRAPLSRQQLDALDNTMTVETGVTLQQVQEAAREAGRLFPLSLASQGSCRIGGNLATNAGGIGVLAYGNARELCLGLEVVLADGRIWDGLRRRLVFMPKRLCSMVPRKRRSGHSLRRPNFPRPARRGSTTDFRESRLTS